MVKKNVLFLCTGNSCRSIMGEALLRARAGELFDVFSAGTEPKRVNPLTLQVLAEIGIDTNGLRSKDVREYLGKMPTHYVIVVCDSAQESCPRIWPGMGERIYWPFDDPPAVQGSDAEKLAAFRRVRDEIDTKIRDWLAIPASPGPSS